MMVEPVRRRRILSPEDRDVSRQRFEAEQRERETKAEAERIRFNKPLALYFKNAILKALNNGRAMQTPDVAAYLNKNGVRCSVVTVRKYLNRLADEDRIVATGVFVAPYWSLNHRYQDDAE